MSMHKEFQVNLIVFFFSSCIVKNVTNSKFALYLLYEYKLNFNLVIYIVSVKVKKEN